MLIPWAYKNKIWNFGVQWKKGGPICNINFVVFLHAIVMFNYLLNLRTRSFHELNNSSVEHNLLFQGKKINEREEHVKELVFFGRAHSKTPAETVPICMWHAPETNRWPNITQKVTIFEKGDHFQSAVIVWLK